MTISLDDNALSSLRKIVVITRIGVRNIILNIDKANIVIQIGRLKRSPVGDRRIRIIGLVLRFVLGNIG